MDKHKIKINLNNNSKIYNNYLTTKETCGNQITTGNNEISCMFLFDLVNCAMHET